MIYNNLNSYFQQIRQPNGDIYLRLVDIFDNQKKKNRADQQFPHNQQTPIQVQEGTQCLM